MADDFTRFRMAWIDQIWADQRLTSTARDIAMRIGTRFNRKRYTESGIFSAWPSYDLLASEAGVSGKTVQRAVTLLKKCGHIATAGAGGRHCSLTYYAIISAKASTEDSDKGGHTCPPLEKSTPADSEKVDTSVPKGGQPCPQKVDTSVLLTSLNKTFDETFDPQERVETSPARAPVGVVVLSMLAAGPTARKPLPPMLRGKEDRFPDLVRDHQAETGWPDLYQRCHDPALRTEALSLLALEMEPVASDSALWLAWKAEYRRRGWPMPKPLEGSACFPDGGPIRLDGFLERMRVAMLNGVVDRARNVVRIGAGKGGRHG